MADKKQETIADVVRKIRNEIDELRKVSPNVRSIAADWWEARADEIEAAHKREAGDAVIKRNHLGDAAKLREACANIAEYARSAQCHTEDAHVLGYLNQIEGWANAALAAPPRNCDRPECATTKAAQDVWRKEDGGKTAYYEWLLATAAEKEGGAK